MSSRVQLDSAQYKVWPPSPQELLQHKMASTTRPSSHRHRAEPRTVHSLTSNSKRYDPRSSASVDHIPFSSKPTKSTTSKVNGYHTSPSTEYVAKPSVPSGSRSQHQTSHPPDHYDQRPRASSSKHRDGTTRTSKSSHEKAIRDPYFSYPVPGSSVPAAPASNNAWPPNPEMRSEAPRKHRSKDKDREKLVDRERERENLRDYERGRSKEKNKDPSEQRPAVYSTATLGRSYKQRTDETIKQPKASSGHRRYHTDDDASPQRLPQYEQQTPALLPTQAPQPVASSTTAPPPSTQQPDTQRTRSRENRRSYSPPPAPLVAPVWLPERDKTRESRSKSHKSQDRMTSANQHSGPSGSDTEREQRSTRNEHRSHQRETPYDSYQASKNTQKKEPKISLSGLTGVTGWFTRKSPKVPVESPTMPTPASVFFSPLPERPIPAPHLVSLSAGQGPSDPHYPYAHHDPSNKISAAFGRSETTSRKHSRSHSSSQLPFRPAPAGTSSSREHNDPGPAARSQTAGAQPQTYSNVPPSINQHSTSGATLSKSHTPVIDSIPPSRSHAPASNRHQTSASVSSNIPPVNPISAPPVRSHQYHASMPSVSQNYSYYGHTNMPLNTDQTRDVSPSSRPEVSASQPQHGHVDNVVREVSTSSGYPNHTSVPPRRFLAPTTSPLPAPSQTTSSRAKHSGSQNPTVLQSTLPPAVSSTASAKVTSDPSVQHQPFNLNSGYGSAPEDLRDRNYNATSSTTNVNQITSSKHDGQSLQTQPHAGQVLDDRSTTETGHMPKHQSSDFYPPGYAPVGSSNPHVSRNTTVPEVKKSSRTRPSPPVVASAISGESNAKVDTRVSSDQAGGKYSWSASPNFSTPSSSYLRTDGEGQGPSSTMASPGVSSASQNSPARRPPSAQPTPRRQSLQVPSVYDYPLRQSGVTAGQQSNSRPSPKPSPTGSHSAVPVHSAHPSPSRPTNPHDIYALGTPSSSSTIMQPPTPRTKSSPSPLKEPLSHSPDVKGQTGMLNTGTNGYSPSRAAQSHDLHTGSQGLVKGSSTPTSVPADMISTSHTNDPRSHGKYRSQSQDYGLREHVTQPAPLRSNTEPVHEIPRRTSVSSLQAGSANPVPHRSVQSPQQNYRPTLHDSYSTQPTHVPQGYLTTQNTQPAEASREQAVPSSKIIQQTATASEYNSRSRKRPTSQYGMDSAPAPTGAQADPHSRIPQEPQTAPYSSRHRDKRTSQIITHSTALAIDVPSHFPRSSSDNVHHVSSTHPAPLTRNTANAPNASLPYSSAPASAGASAPYSSAGRNQSGSVGRSTQPPVAPPSHSRTSSEQVPSSQPSRVAIAGHLSTPAPVAYQLRPRTTSQDSDLLRTPSSLAPTLKKQPSYTASRPPSAQSSQESKKKGGLFTLVQSLISSTGKQKETPAPAPVAPQPEQRPTKLRRSSSSKYQGDGLEAMKSPGSSTTRVIALPPVVPQNHNVPVATHAQDRKVPPPKGFHPWKLLSRRHRTVSAASVEALDGTGTGIHATPDESVRSSDTSGIYPSLRDPMEATQEWRNREEMEMMDRGTVRRRRPGVTFEVVDDRSDSEIRPRPQRSSKLR